MRLTGKFLVAGCAALLLSGCGTLNSLTGQTDNTVLPGQREEAIPGRASFPEKDGAAGAKPSTGSTAANDETYCAPDDPACKPPGTTGDTFSDPQ
jgi:hypothetical protein